MRLEWKAIENKTWMDNLRQDLAEKDMDPRTEQTEVEESCKNLIVGEHLTEVKRRKEVITILFPTLNAYLPLPL